MSVNIKKITRIYGVPFIATISALGLWYRYGNGEYLWFLMLIGGILILNMWVFVSEKKEF
jgi:hypothetical protein